jgi:uncharacterized membrane protein
MRPAIPLPAVLAVALLAACNAPQPDVPDEPPTPQATAAALPDVSRPARVDRPARPLDRTPATPDLPPPGTDNPTWKEAAARGVVFRAVGQEPGWYVEVGGPDAPGLHAVLDYGERTVDIAQVEGMDGDQGYRGTADDGTEVVVRTSDGPCFDGMSGHRFPTKVELAVGDQTYDGCGAYLQVAP